jgi:glutathione S-transferase
MTYFSRRIALSGGPFFLGKELSVVDLCVTRFIVAINGGGFDHISSTVVKDNYPVVWTMYEATITHPVYVKQMEREVAAGSKI